MTDMTPWQVIEATLFHRKQKPSWLAAKLDVTDQVVSNWKSRGVPPSRYRVIADTLKITVDQLEGLAPLPWEKDSAWPFPGIDRARFDRLDLVQKGEIQGKVREMIENFEQEPEPLGKSSGSRSSAGR